MKFYTDNKEVTADRSADKKQRGSYKAMAISTQKVAEMAPNVTDPTKNTRQVPTQSNLPRQMTSSNNTCPICNQQHDIDDCPTFLKKL